MAKSTRSPSNALGGRLANHNDRRMNNDFPVSIGNLYQVLRLDQFPQRIIASEYFETFPFNLFDDRLYDCE